MSNAEEAAPSSVKAEPEGAGLAFTAKCFQNVLLIILTSFPGAAGSSVQDGKPSSAPGRKARLIKLLSVITRHCAAA